MVMIKDKEGIERFSLPTAVMKIIDRVKCKIHTEDDEVWGIIWGARGSGKSLKAMHLGYAIDSTLEDEDGINRICFDKKEFKEAVLNSRKQVVIGDEGISLFFSRGSMSREGREMAALSDQIRQKNLCILICVPKLLTIDKLVLDDDNLSFIAYVWKSRKMINGKMVTLKGNTAIYLNIKKDNRVAKMIKYMKARKNNPNKWIPRPKPHLLISGDAVTKKPWYPVSEKAYRNKKESILHKDDDKDIEKKPKRDRNDRIDFDLMYLLFDQNKTNKYIAEKCVCSKVTVSKHKQKWKKDKLINKNKGYRDISLENGPLEAI